MHFLKQLSNFKESTHRNMVSACLKAVTLAILKGRSVQLSRPDEPNHRHVSPAKTFVEGDGIPVALGFLIHRQNALDGVLCLQALLEKDVPFRRIFGQEHAFERVANVLELCWEDSDLRVVFHVLTNLGKYLFDPSTDATLSLSQAAGVLCAVLCSEAEQAAHAAATQALRWLLDPSSRSSVWDGSVIAPPAVAAASARAAAAAEVAEGFTATHSRRAGNGHGSGSGGSGGGGNSVDMGTGAHLLHARRLRCLRQMNNQSSAAAVAATTALPHPPREFFLPAIVQAPVQDMELAAVAERAAGGGSGVKSVGGGVPPGFHPSLVESLLLMLRQVNPEADLAPLVVQRGTELLRLLLRYTSLQRPLIEGMAPLLRTQLPASKDKVGDGKGRGQRSNANADADALTAAAVRAEEEEEEEERKKRSRHHHGDGGGGSGGGSSRGMVAGGGLHLASLDIPSRASREREQRLSGGGTGKRRRVRIGRDGKPLLSKQEREEEEARKKLIQHVPTRPADAKAAAAAGAVAAGASKGGRSGKGGKGGKGSRPQRRRRHSIVRGGGGVGGGGGSGSGSGSGSSEVGRERESALRRSVCQLSTIRLVQSLAVGEAVAQWGSDAQPAAPLSAASHTADAHGTAAATAAVAAAAAVADGGNGSGGSGIDTTTPTVLELMSASDVLLGLLGCLTHADCYPVRATAFNALWTMVKLNKQAGSRVRQILSPEDFTAFWNIRGGGGDDTARARALGDSAMQAFLLERLTATKNALLQATLKRFGWECDTKLRLLGQMDAADLASNRRQKPSARAAAAGGRRGRARQGASGEQTMAKLLGFSRTSSLAQYYQSSGSGGSGGSGGGSGSGGATAAHMQGMREALRQAEARRAQALQRMAERNRDKSERFVEPHAKKAQAKAKADAHAARTQWLKQHSLTEESPTAANSGGIGGPASPVAPPPIAVTLHPREAVHREPVLGGNMAHAQQVMAEVNSAVRHLPFWETARGGLAAAPSAASLSRGGGGGDGDVLAIMHQSPSRLGVATPLHQMHQQQRMAQQQRQLQQQSAAGGGGNGFSPASSRSPSRARSGVAARRRRSSHSIAPAVLVVKKKAQTLYTPLSVAVKPDGESEGYMFNQRAHNKARLLRSAIDALDMHSDYSIVSAKALAKLIIAATQGEAISEAALRVLADTDAEASDSKASALAKFRMAGTQLGRNAVVLKQARGDADNKDSTRRNFNGFVETERSLPRMRPFYTQHELLRIGVPIVSNPVRAYRQDHTSGLLEQALQQHLAASRKADKLAAEAEAEAVGSVVLFNPGEGGVEGGGGETDGDGLSVGDGELSMAQLEARWRKVQAAGSRATRNMLWAAITVHRFAQAHRRKHDLPHPCVRYRELRKQLQGGKGRRSGDNSVTPSRAASRMSRSSSRAAAPSRSGAGTLDHASRKQGYNSGRRSAPSPPPPAFATQPHQFLVESDMELPASPSTVDAAAKLALVSPGSFLRSTAGASARRRATSGASLAAAAATGSKTGLPAGGFKRVAVNVSAVGKVATEAKRAASAAGQTMTQAGASELTGAESERTNAGPAAAATAKTTGSGGGLDPWAVKQATARHSDTEWDPAAVMNMAVWMRATGRLGAGILPGEWTSWKKAKVASKPHRNVYTTEAPTWTEVVTAAAAASGNT